MNDVCLVLMPFAAIERPSLALSLLKASLTENGITATVLYPNLWFAEEIGLLEYTKVSEGQYGMLIGEWLFSEAAFPDFQANHKEYFATENEEIPKKAWSIRKKATSFIERVAQSVLELKPRIVACSSTFYQHCATLALLRRIRQLNPEIVTVMGGANCEGIMGLTLLRAVPWVDFVCSGDGDELFAKLCSLVLNKGRDVKLTELPYGVMGPCHRHSNLPATDAPRASVQDLERIPIPDFDDYFLALQTSKISPYIQPGLPIETSRGCWWGQKHHCTFCGLNGSGMTYRSKSPERVQREFTDLSKRYGLSKFFVVDNILDLRHVNTVLPTFAALQSPYSLFYETKANLKRHQLQQLGLAGVRWIQPGIENLHDEALKLLNKGTTAAINIQLLKWAREFGIHVAWNFLAVIPGESREWYKEMLTWLPEIIHLQPPSGVTPIRFDRFSPYHQHPENYGLNLSPDRDYSYIFPFSPEVLSNLIYYFEDQNDREMYQEHQALQEMCLSWKNMFSSQQPPILSMKEEVKGELLRIFDTRPCAITEEITLTGLACQVYLACDTALSPQELISTLNQKYALHLSWDEVQPVVKELRERKILLQLSSKLLSLALKEPIAPLKDFKEHPSGYVDRQQYTIDRSKAKVSLYRTIERLNKFLKPV